MTQNEKPEAKNEGKKQREQEDSFEEDMSQNHHPEQQQNQHEKNGIKFYISQLTNFHFFHHL